MNKTTIREISKYIGLSYILNKWFEYRYKDEIKHIFKMAKNEMTSYKEVFLLYMNLLKIIPARANISIEARNLVHQKLINAR